MPVDHDLQRFVDAQATTYATALAEIRAGRKRSHWMWFIFPQIQGLGRSETAQHYAIASRDEASAYLAHPVLGPRLREITTAALEHPGLSATALFGQPDDLKFHSSLTLFAAVAEDPEPFREALKTFFAGQPDEATLTRLC
ncbi:DUF1810 domain-containing protein [Pseudomonas oryzihabitans]|uniref:DUF1810 domain-containing protein n=1 Tax=Pseudomonas oryzihabitans TaxID=47885 RepID=UPI003EC0DE71